MEKPEFSCTLLSKLDLDDIEKVVKGAYHKEDGPGRPPRKPMGIFKALMVKRLQQIPSERELCRRMWKDDNLRELCDTKRNRILIIHRRCRCLRNASEREGFKES
jgi:hypothetical protein